LFDTKKQGGNLRPALRQSGLKQRHDHQRDDVDDLDQRVHRGAGGVLVRVAHGVAGDGGLVRFRTFAAEVAFLDVFLGVIPRAAAGGHRDRDEDAGDDGADQHAAERLRAEGQADDHRYGDGQQRRDDHFPDRGLGQHVHAGAVFRFASTGRRR